MKKYALLFSLIILSISTLYSEAYAEGTVNVSWILENTAFGRAGFSAAPPSGDFNTIPEAPGEFVLDSVHRENDHLQATNSSDQYIFWQLYGWDNAYRIYIAATELATADDTSHIPYALTFEGNGLIEGISEEGLSPDKNIGNDEWILLYEYNSSVGVAIGSVKMTALATIPDTVSNETYTGKIYLKLEVK